MAAPFYSVLVASLIAMSASASGQEDSSARAGQIPAAVVRGLKARFPGAAVQKWDREKEGEVVLYDIEFRQGGKKFEADIHEDGTIDNWERAVPPESLPGPVREAVMRKYPAARIREAMEVTSVRDGKDVLQGFEVTLRTKTRNGVELTVAPDGTILEDAGGRE